MTGINALTTIVVDTDVFQIDVDAAAAPRSFRVAARVNFGTEWVFEEPGWRQLAYGFTGERRLYLWSARNLIVLPNDPSGGPEVVSTDEDIVFVFDLGSAWLLVCETSVRLVRGQEEVSRVELADVVVEAYLQGSRLTIREMNGGESRVDVLDGILTV